MGYWKSGDATNGIKIYSIYTDALASRNAECKSSNRSMPIKER